MRTLPKRLAKSEDGGPATQWAILLTLFAVVSGFALFILGDALYTLYSEVSESPFGENLGPGIAPGSDEAKIQPSG